MENKTLRVIRAALYVAGGVDRGFMKYESDEIREAMAKAELPDEHFEEVRTMVGAFLSFAHDIRASERKKRPIPRAAGETLPER